MGQFRCGSEYVHVFFIVYLYIYMLQLEINLSRGEGDDLINRFNPPHICACLNLGPGFPRSYVVVFLCLASSFEIRGDCSFC